MFAFCSALLIRPSVQILQVEDRNKKAKRKIQDWLEEEREEGEKREERRLENEKQKREQRKGKRERKRRERGYGVREGLKLEAGGSWVQRTLSAFKLFVSPRCPEVSEGALFPC